MSFFVRAFLRVDGQKLLPARVCYGASAPPRHRRRNRSIQPVNLKTSYRNRGQLSRLRANQVDVTLPCLILLGQNGNPDLAPALSSSCKGFEAGRARGPRTIHMLSVAAREKQFPTILIEGQKGTGNFSDSAEKPPVHPSRASGRTEER